MKTAAINGFGRFGLHLLRYWLDHRAQAQFNIVGINDDTLTVEKSVEIMRDDPYVKFDDFQLAHANNELVLQSAAETLRIPYTTTTQDKLPWLGQVDLVLECSGKFTDAPKAQAYLVDKTKLVLISATSWNADKTIVYGFNHQEFDPAKTRIISYGSCTVNAYVPFAKYIHELYGVLDSDVNVVHNIPAYQLPKHNTLLRKFCTLEKSGPKLLPFLDPEKNYTVTYTVVPWTGVSMFDYRFRLKKPPTRDSFLAATKEAIKSGPLKGLYNIALTDEGPNAHNCTPYSAVFVEPGIKMLTDNLYIPAYFDTENSVNRYFDLTNYTASKI